MEYTFCFVDLAGYTALTEAHGDSAAADLALVFVAMVRDALGDGTLVDTIGDAVFVVTSHPAEAIGFVGRLWDRAAARAGFPALRAGLHHGDAVERDGRYFGSAVNLAARVAAQAGGQDVLATHIVAEAARGLGIDVTSRGAVRLRNVVDPVELFALRIEQGENLQVVDPVCRMRVNPASAAGRLRFGERTYFFCSLDCSARFAARPAVYAGGGGVPG